MADDKPCIAELYESGGLDMELVGKIAHNELDKRKGTLCNSEHALASEYIDAYIDDYHEVIKNYADELDSKLTVEDYHNGKISPEFVLGVALSHGAASHASCDIEYFNDEFSSRAINEVYEVLAVHGRVQFACQNADDFSLAGVNPEKKFPIGFVSVKDVADTISELGSDHMKEALKSSDMERIASNLAEAEQRIDRDELADGIMHNAELEVEIIDLKQGGQSLDDICNAKSEEVELVDGGTENHDIEQAAR
ncbi:hypothetical protein [Collinsella aerofaciens]|uniref:hypothetical protein n=1 Tax=Collinsella aerofaciens TaxID=74426 RepID=UPI003D794060